MLILLQKKALLLMLCFCTWLNCMSVDILHEQIVSEKRATQLASTCVTLIKE